MSCLGFLGCGEEKDYDNDTLTLSELGDRVSGRYQYSNV
jgi:hypothetical protein